MGWDTTKEDPGERRGGRVIPFLLVVGVCLAAGIWLGSLAGGCIASGARSGETSASYTLLGYDSLQAPTVLRSIWILALDGKGGATYLGISPATVILTKDGQAAVLREFLADPLGAPARLFQVDRIPQPSTAIAFDRQGLTVIINRMGGIRIDGRPVRGQDVLSLLDSATDPLDQLRLQSKVVSALFVTNGPCLGEAALSGLDPTHLLSNLPADILVADCIKRGPYLTDTISVDILDEVMPLDLPDGSIGFWPKD